MADSQPESVTVRLCGTDYKIRKLTLRQARSVGIGILKDAPQQTPDEMFVSSVDQAVAVVACALSRDYPEITQDKILDMETGVREIRDAADAILLFSGFVTQAKEATPGETASGEGAPGAA